MSKVSVIIAAAGNAERMNGIHKQLAMLKGKPVLAYSMIAFQAVPQVSEIIIAARECDADIITNIARENGIDKFVGCSGGGDTRQQSVLGALRMVSEDAEYIAVHDAARPLVTADEISRCIEDAAHFGASALGVPVKDTIKTVEGGIITGTPDRSTLYITQTPQIFKKEYYIRGVENASAHGLDFTDDCQLAEAVGIRVNMTLSSYTNIKITTPEDMQIAELLLR